MPSCPSSALCLFFQSAILTTPRCWKTSAPPKSQATTLPNKNSKFTPQNRPKPSQKEWRVFQFPSIFKVSKILVSGTATVSPNPNKKKVNPQKKRCHHVSCGTKVGPNNLLKNVQLSCLVKMNDFAERHQFLVKLEYFTNLRTVLK